MRRRFTPFALLGVVGCVDIIVVDHDGGGGSGPADTGVGGSIASSMGGAPVTSGAGGDPEPDLGPCSSLTWAGSALELDAGFGARALGLVALDGGRLAVVSLENEVLVSRVIEDAFGAWPPVLGEAVQHEAYWQGATFGPIAGRADGTFAFGGEASAAFVVGVPGVTAFYEPESTIMLDRAPGAGAHVLTWDPRGERYGVRHFEQVAEEAIAFDLGLLPETVPPPACALRSGVSEGPFALVSIVPSIALECGAFDGLQRFAISPNEGIVPLGVANELPGSKHWLAPNGADVWSTHSFPSNFGEHPSGGAAVRSIDWSGNVIAEWFHSPGDPTTTWGFASWENGHAVAAQQDVQVQLLVIENDGIVSLTTSPSPLLSGSPEQALPLASGGTQARSIYVGLDTSPTLRLLRADCMSVAP